jgi:hypothetical protein
MLRSSRPAAARAALTRLAPAALVALLAACGGGDDKSTGPRTSGSFSGNVTGGVTRSINGVAFYSQGAQGGASAFALGMGSVKADNSFRDAVLITREQAGVPAPGTYALHDNESEADQRPQDFGLMATLDVANADGLLCFGTGGTLTVESTGGGRVRGRYNATASCLDTAAMDEVPITLTGTFDAVEDGRAAARARSVGRRRADRAPPRGARPLGRRRPHRPPRAGGRRAAAAPAHVVRGRPAWIRSSPGSRPSSSRSSGASSCRYATPSPAPRAPAPTSNGSSSSSPRWTSSSSSSSRASTTPARARSSTRCSATRCSRWATCPPRA